ncbi:MAG: hypothetical protein JO263_02305 [Candidatus Eremiobacteraeota bacterium]|nr:hypothetical protein [Candidatus Eremiobacteraeota bacterium]
MYFSSATLRRIGVGSLIAVLCTFTALPGQTQTMRQQIAEKVVVDAANTFVSKIEGESCSQFAGTMSQMKQNKSGSSTSSKLKNNPALRSKFVNIVAGPLMNKMIDCDMLPGGM